MAVNDHDFTTGPAKLPDIGELSYNGCVFSPLFESKLSGSAIKDVSNRTVKYVEYTLTVDGYVTLPTGEVDSTSDMMTTLRNLLQAQGGYLVYLGRGNDITVNPVGQNGTRDVAWGPIPELLEFVPLGAGRSAKVQWTCKTRIPETTPQPRPASMTNPLAKYAKQAGLTNVPTTLNLKAPIPLLQFNYETVVSYGEDGYSSISVNGTLEIALTRTPSQKTRTVVQTADDLRPVIEGRIMSSIDLTRFRVTNREFKTSYDKRTLDWSFKLEELPYFDLYPQCTVVRGNYSVRPAKAGMGLALWFCTLRVTYTLRADAPRRYAWHAFLTLMRWRMAQSAYGYFVETLPVGAPGAGQGGGKGAFGGAPVVDPVNINIEEEIRKIEAAKATEEANAKAAINEANKAQRPQPTFKKRNADPYPPESKRKCFLMDFNIDEGLYLDSKTITFAATWKLVTMFSHLLLASGIWRKLDEEDDDGNNQWAMSMTIDPPPGGQPNIMGAQSWLQNRVDPKLDIIVDFGS